MDDDAREVLSVAGIARRFDADLLDHALSDDDLADQCQRAVALGLASVVCRPYRVAVAARAVEGSDVAVCTGLNVLYDAWSDPSLPDARRPMSLHANPPTHHLTQIAKPRTIRSSYPASTSPVLRIDQFAQLGEFRVGTGRRDEDAVALIAGDLDGHLKRAVVGDRQPRSW